MISCGILEPWQDNCEWSILAKLGSPSSCQLGELCKWKGISRDKDFAISLKNPGGGWELNVESDDCGGNASFTSVEVDANSPELRFQQRFEGDVFP